MALYRAAWTNTRRPRLRRLPRLSRDAGLASLRQRAARQNVVYLTHIGRTRLTCARAQHVCLTVSPCSPQDRTRARPPRNSRLTRLSRDVGPASLRQRARRQNAVKLTHLGRTGLPSARAPDIYLTEAPRFPTDQIRTRRPRLSRLPRLSLHAGLASLRQRAARQNAVKRTHMGHPRPPSAPAPHVYLTAVPCSPPDQTRTTHPSPSRVPRLSRDAGLTSRRQRAA